jgi:hypothetical protein
VISSLLVVCCVVILVAVLHRILLLSRPASSCAWKPGSWPEKQCGVCLLRLLTTQSPLAYSLGACLACFVPAVRDLLLFPMAVAAECDLRACGIGVCRLLAELRTARLAFNGCRQALLNAVLHEQSVCAVDLADHRAVHTTPCAHTATTVDVTTGLWVRCLRRPWTGLLPHRGLELLGFRQRLMRLFLLMEASSSLLSIGHPALLCAAGRQRALGVEEAALPA